MEITEKATTLTHELVLFLKMKDNPHLNAGDYLKIIKFPNVI